LQNYNEILCSSPNRFYAKDQGVTSCHVGDGQQYLDFFDPHPVRLAIPRFTVGRNSGSSSSIRNSEAAQIWHKPCKSMIFRVWISGLNRVSSTHAPVAQLD
jgi:hypothetical protein